MNTAERAARLAGTRMLILEETTDALVTLLVASGAATKAEAGYALARLSERLNEYAAGRTETAWCFLAPELIEQAARLSEKATLLRSTR